jgi:hypothetical protein
VLRLMEQQHRRMVREVRNGRYDPEGPKPFGYNIISNRTLDEVILEWLTSDGGGQGLSIDLDEEEAFFEGSKRIVALSIRTASDATPVAGATVWVRLFDPRTTPTKLFQGATDDQWQRRRVDHDPRPRRGQGASRLPREARGPGRGADPPHPSFGVAFSGRLERAGGPGRRRISPPGRSRQTRSCAFSSTEKRPKPSTGNPSRPSSQGWGSTAPGRRRAQPRHRPEGPLRRNRARRGDRLEIVHFVGGG